MNLLIDFGKEKTSFALETIAPLRWLSFAIETATLWYFGRSEFNLSFSRERGTAGCVLFHVGPTNPHRASLSNALHYSAMCTISQDKAFPSELVHPFRAGESKAGTIIEIRHLHPTLTFAELAYMIAETYTEFFKDGAINGRAQFSRRQGQLYANIALSAEELDKMGKGKCGYEDGESVGDLPWS